MMTTRGDETMLPSGKRPRTAPEPSQTVLAITGPPPEATSVAEAGTDQVPQLSLRLHRRVDIAHNPQLERLLIDRQELGYSRQITAKKLTFETFEVDCVELRRCITDTMTKVLQVRLYGQMSHRAADIETVATDVASLTADACMSALYAKLRNIHRAYSKHGARYSAAPSYSKDIELPLPFALAIEEFGVFETHSLDPNLLLAPTYPEGTRHEGKSSDEFQMTDYLAYVPLMKELQIPCKAVDSRIKSGTAWWTLIVRNTHHVTDLQMLLPPSHYTDLAAQIRACFLAGTAADSSKSSDFVKFEATATIFGTKYRDLQTGYNVRAFLALCHGPEEEWSHYV